MCVSRLNAYVPTSFDFQTTNNKMYKDFRFVHEHEPERVKKIEPMVYPVQTKSLPGHFKTMNQQELKKHAAATKQVDRIPYP